MTTTQPGEGIARHGILPGGLWGIAAGLVAAGVMTFIPTTWGGSTDLGARELARAFPILLLYTLPLGLLNGILAGGAGAYTLTLLRGRLGLYLSALVAALIGLLGVGFFATITASGMTSLLIGVVGFVAAYAVSWWQLRKGVAGWGRSA